MITQEQGQAAGTILKEGNIFARIFIYIFMYLFIAIAWTVIASSSELDNFIRYSHSDFKQIFYTMFYMIPPSIPIFILEIIIRNNKKKDSEKK